MVRRQAILNVLLSPMGGFAVFVALLGATAAWIFQPTSDSDLIERYARIYHSDTGNAPTDCAARPGATAPVRLIVVCQPEGGEPVIYVLDGRGGEIADPARPANET